MPPATPAPVPPAGAAPCRDPVTRDIPAWSITNTGIYVRPGDSVRITATGRWRQNGTEVGPEGRGGGGCPQGALALRVGKFHDRQCVRAGAMVSPQREGYLWLFQNSMDIHHARQTGALKVTITGGDSCSGKRPEGMLSVFEDPAFDRNRLAAFEPVCGKIPVHFETDSPDDPRVKDYVQNFMGGDPAAFLRKVVLVGCAANFGSPEAFPPHYRNRDMRIVHYLGARKFGELGRAPYREGRAEFWDFDLSFKPEELEPNHYGAWGPVPEVLLHEMGHVLAPDGAVGIDSAGVPRWVQETYADMLCTKFGSCIQTMDNPEHWVLYGRKQPYCDGYLAGAPLLHTLEEQQPGFIHKFSAQILMLGNARRWPGSEPVFRQIIGRGLAEYYPGYLRELSVTLDQPVAQCEFPE
jgi:hypothetical protein